jgi:hypoxanthine phosphoribosyltransferase
MQKIQLHDKWFEPYISREKIAARVTELATQIRCIGILNGSFIFAADLFRSLTIDAEISFIKLASYKGTSSTGSVVTAIGLDENLYDRHVIIIEDIIDTGKTLSAFLPEIIQRHPASIRIASLLTKPEALKHDIHADYVAFEIPDRFIVGYGLDFDGLGRNIPALYILSEE